MINRITYKSIITLLLCFISVSVFSQNTELKHFYIKLNPSLNFNSAEELLQKTNLNNLQTSYTFSVHDAYAISKSKIDALAKKSNSGFTLKNTFRIEGNFNKNETDSFLLALNNLEDLVYAVIENNRPIPPPHDITPITSNYESNQGYLEVNPGLNIRHAWTNGYNGNTINIRDIEYGLNVNHEDIDHQNASLEPGRTINSGATESYTEHGTAVGGIIYANNGSYGITGIAHGANEYITYLEWTNENGYNRPLAISTAIANSNAGDIIVFEMQAFGNNSNFVPAEYEQTVWDLTKAATDSGIVIVAAAGNGNENLNDTFYNAYNSRGDSGAIIVGAGSSDTSHTPMSFSTYGTRVDVHAWGQNVWSTGKYASSILVGSDFNQSYYPSFSGTSSATAILGGFTAVLQSYYFGQSGSYLTSIQMRDIMIATGIPQGTGKEIGPMPYMSSAMTEVDNVLNTENFKLSTFNVFPNPSNGTFNINFSKQPTTNKRIELFNVLGQSVYKSKTKQKHLQLNLSHLQKGIYLIKIEDNNTSTVKKLIIN